MNTHPACRYDVPSMSPTYAEADLRIYDSGIVSSKGESIFCLEDPRPHRLAFDLMRIMRTDYRIDDFQECFFVIDGYEQLFEATRPDFTPYYAALEQASDIAPGAVLPGEHFHRFLVHRKGEPVHPKCWPSTSARIEGVGHGAQADRAEAAVGHVGRQLFQMALSWAWVGTERGTPRICGAPPISCVNRPLPMTADGHPGIPT